MRREIVEWSTLKESAISRSVSPAATRFKALARLMLRQLWLAAEPRALGHGAGAAFVGSLDFEMDAIAHELRKDSLHTCDDDQLASRQLHKIRLPHLTKEEFLDFLALARALPQPG